MVKIISRPEMFNAIAIDECVSTLLQRRTDETDEITKETQALSKKFWHKNNENPEKFHFMLLPPKKPVYLKTEKMLKEIQESICFFGLTRRLMAWVSNYLPLVEETLARNVDFKIILPQLTKDQRLKSLGVCGNIHVSN